MQQARNHGPQEEGDLCRNQSPPDNSCDGTRTQSGEAQSIVQLRPTSGHGGLIGERHVTTVPASLRAGTPASRHAGMKTSRYRSLSPSTESSSPTVSSLRARCGTVCFEELIFAVSHKRNLRNCRTLRLCGTAKNRRRFFTVDSGGTVIHRVEALRAVERPPCSSLAGLAANLLKPPTPHPGVRGCVRAGLRADQHSRLPVHRRSGTHARPPTWRLGGLVAGIPARRITGAPAAVHSGILADRVRRTPVFRHSRLPVRPHAGTSAGPLTALPVPRRPGVPGDQHTGLQTDLVDKAG
jgi:hypothetical protein